MLHNAFPRFAERGEGGGYQQQDANECWVEILRMLQVLSLVNLYLTSEYYTLSILQARTPSTESSTKDSAVEQFLGIECSSETKCAEVLYLTFVLSVYYFVLQAEGEEPTKSVEKFLQFSCYIDKDCKYLHTGLKNRLSK